MRNRRMIITLVLMLVIGFAAISTTLILNGKVGIIAQKDDFNVIFIEGTLNGEISSNIVIGDNKQKLTFNTNKITNVGEKEEIEYKIKNTSTQYDADVTINCTNEDNEYIKVSGKLDNKGMPVTEGIRIGAQEIKSGIVVAEMIKSYTGEDEANLSVTCTVQANAVEREATAEKDYTGESGKLNFNVNGGTTLVESKDIKVGETYGELPIPERVGYTFDGWYTEEENGEKVEEDRILNSIEGETIYAHWTAKTYNLTFNSNGGEEITDEISVTYDETYGSLPTPEKTGYTFAGWYKDSEYNEKIESTTKVDIVDNTMLYAKWSSNTYIITFDSDGGNNVSSKEVTYNGLYGDLVTPTRNGYTFNGWYNGEEVITSETRVNITENTTLIAKWNANKYTVSLNTDGGEASVGSIEVTYDENYTNLPTPTKVGHTFTGWYNGDTKIDNSTKVSITEDTTLVAKWNANKYTVNFNANTGSVTTSQKKVTYNGTYGELPTPTKAGYTFNGWYTEAINGTQVTDATIVNIISDQTLYAKWTANSGITYKVLHWQQNVGGNANSHDSTNYTLVNTDNNTGTTDEKITPSVNSYTGFTSPSTEELIVKADGSAEVNYYYTRNEYNVTINKDSGVTSVNGNGKHQYGEPITIGYTIANGYSFESITGDKTASSFTMPANDVIVTVNTTENTYTITYIMNNGTNNSSNPTSYKVTTDNINLQEPTRLGYTFTGWTGSNGTTASKNITITKGSYGDKSYTANWQANTYTVSFNSNGGDTIASTLTVTYDGTYGNTLPMPERLGYTFDGWYTDATNGERIENSTKVTITENQTLYAHWTANTYTINYNLDSGTAGINQPTSATYDSVVTISNPTRDGYTFAGWTVTSGLNTSTAKYGTSSTEVTSAISDNITKVKVEYFKNLTTGSSVTLKANWEKELLALPENVTLTNDVNNNGFADIGDKITVGTESFYVISHTATKLNALAEYNLNVGKKLVPNATYGIQNKDARGWMYGGTGLPTYGTIAFSKAYGWKYENNDTIDIRNEAYRVGARVAADTMTALDALYSNNAEAGITGYEKYIQGIVPSTDETRISVRFITKGEIEELINAENALKYGDDIKSIADEAGYSWLYYTSYWTQSSSSDDKSVVFGLNSRGVITSFRNDVVDYGVRPVITIEAESEYSYYNVTFDANGGNAIDRSIDVKYEKEYGELPTPTHNNSSYEFGGWYKENGEYISSTTFVSLKENHTLKAEWKIKLPENVSLTNDINGNGIVDEGDKITVGTESFYVIFHTAPVLNALAEYNLNVGSNPVPNATYGIQNKLSRGSIESFVGKTYGGIIFSKSNGWGNTIDIRNAVYREGNSVTKTTMTALDALYSSNPTEGITGYDEYMQGIVPNTDKTTTSVRLIDKGEIEGLINDGKVFNSYDSINTPQLRQKQYYWLYSTSYWTQSTGFNAYDVWNVSAKGGSKISSLSYNTRDNYYGVRPVLTISLS